MSKFRLLVKQLYKQKVKSKSFILMTALYVAVITAVLFWSDIRALFADDTVDQIGLINTTAIDVSAAYMNSEDIEWVFETDEQLAKEKVEDGEYLSYVVLSEADNQLVATITSYDPLTLNVQQFIQLSTENAAQFYAMGSLNLTEQQMATLLQVSPNIIANTLNDDVTDGKSTEEKSAGMWASYVSGFLIYFFVVTYLSMITTDIASEKGSRALEMLLVSVRPETHFKAKIAGVFLLALTQFGVLLAALIAIISLAKGGAMWDSVLSVIQELSVSYIIYIVVFLFATIILFLIIGALFGSLVSKVEEASQVMTPAIMTTLIGFYIMLSGLGNPDTMLIKVFSYIPFTSGMVMPMRIGATDIQAWAPIVSLMVLIVTIIGLYFFTLSFYKRSVLTYASGGIFAKIKSVFKFTT